MGKQTSISWCDSTFNPWIGCTKVSPGCAHCYAERESKRWGKNLWGPRADRQITSDPYWRQPLKWDEGAAASGKPWRVFCGSFCDVFEDHYQIIGSGARTRLFKLIEDTPHLTWLLLTKRPENIAGAIPKRWAMGLPENVWIGVSAEDQQRYMERVQILVRIPARVRFISAEPLLGPINLGLPGTANAALGIGYQPYYRLLHWVIVGGESGPGHRAMNIEWARDLLRQCREAEVSFFFKQIGGWPHKRHDPSQWPEDLRVQEFPG